MVRPKKEGELRTIIIRTYITPSDKKRLDKLRDKISTSDFMRDLIEMAWFNSKSKRIHGVNMANDEYEKSHTTKILDGSKFK